MSFAVNRNQVLVGVMLAVAATLVWSGNFIVARGVKNTIPPVTLAFFRWFCASAILLPFGIRQVLKEWPAIRTNLPLLFLGAVMGISLFNTFVYVAGHYSDAINLALIGTTSSPVMSIIMARIFLKEMISKARFIGVLLCISGILLLVSKGDLNNLLHLKFTKGDAWILLAAFSFAVYNIVTRKRTSAITPVSYLTVVFVAGTLFLAPAWLWERSYSVPVHWDTNNVLIILYLGLGTSVFSFLCWNAAIARLGAGRTSLFGNLIPVFSTVEAAIILKEKITWLHVVSFVIIIAGLFIANLKDVYKQRQLPDTALPLK